MGGAMAVGAEEVAQACDAIEAAGERVSVGRQASVSGCPAVLHAGAQGAWQCVVCPGGGATLYPHG